MNINKKPWSLKKKVKIQRKIWSISINDIVSICKTPGPLYWRYLEIYVSLLWYPFKLSETVLQNKGNYHLLAGFYKLISY